MLSFVCFQTKYTKLNLLSFVGMTIFVENKIIVDKDIIIEQLKKEFEGRESFSKRELFDFYLRFHPQLKETTFRWRIHDLKDKGVIGPVSRELLSFTNKPVFKPEIAETERRLTNRLMKQFFGLRLCIWSTRILNEFMLHQPGKFITILEVEKAALEPVFHFLKDNHTKEVYLLPGEKELERYVYESRSGIIIESLVSKAPVQKVNHTPTVTIEKIIVDLFSDQRLFHTYQGSELTNIIDSAYEKYQLDFTKLFSYAKRRRKETDLKDYLSRYTNIPQLLYDRP